MGDENNYTNTYFDVIGVKENLFSMAINRWNLPLRMKPPDPKVALLAIYVKDNIQYKHRSYISILNPTYLLKLNLERKMS